MQKPRELIIILILFLVQFIDVLDFMIVMPLGPDFAIDLRIPHSRLGLLASSYTLAAAFAGILSSTIVDKYERKRLFIFTLIGLILANIFSANAWNFNSLLFSRFLAGVFGGPMTSICFAIVADLFEDKRRGAVMGKIMSGFSFAAILGVPIGLKLSTNFGWSFSFYTVALLGVVTCILIFFYMPEITEHLESAKTNKVSYR
ncbi:MAG: MFS transporter, partial [Pseudomonadota bacterium]